MLYEIVADTAADSLRLLPFLFCTYLALEYLEAHMGNKTIAMIQKSGRFGPYAGAFLGIVPQCGFSAAATNLYAGRVITTGTLLAVYLSTSDEMLPILLSESIAPGLIFFILSVKVIAAIITGVLADWFLRKKHREEAVNIEHFCEKEQCDCHHGIFRAALRHTLQIVLYIAAVTFAFNLAIAFVGEKNISGFLLNRPFIGELLAGIIGLIPNCAASVMLTKLYLEGGLNLGAMIAGLLTGAGVGLMVLFRVNDNVKQNLKIAGILYLVGVGGGIAVNLGLVLLR